MDDLLREFLTESSENVLRIEQEIVLLERRPNDKDLLGSIFRSMHTIKGTCGFLGLGRMEKVAHAAENVLGAVRDGKLTLADATASDVLAAVDVIKGILEGLEKTEAEPGGDDTGLIARLNRWLSEERGGSDDELDRLFTAAQAAAGGTSPAPAPVPAPVTAPAPVPDKDRTGQAGTQSVSDQTLRVDVGVLDRLMNLAGELVLTRNQLSQLSQRDEDSAFNTPVQQLNRVTTDLQEAVMKTRMQPVGNAWGKLPRLIRDLSGASGKKIDLVMLGAETELDRQILQAIQDPLTHMVRNSADHGIEDPNERLAAGKPERGRIDLEACHEGGHIVIEVRDDGRGLDVARIKAKAVERALATAEAVASMPDHRAFDFIFEAGFSTAQQVTAVSGRGVGMDVVRRNIEKIGGTVEVQSIKGVGSTFRIKIPLTLAIMSALIVGVRGQAFAIPQIGVLELVRISDGTRRLVENVNGALFYRLRDQLLPLVRLDGVLGLPTAEEVDGSIVVCQLGASRFGLIVDTIYDTHEIVVKPVGRMVKAIRVYAGTSILGDGRVILILDIPGIAQAAEVLARGEGMHVGEDEEKGQGEMDTGASLLLFDAGVEAPRAVPLSQVSRLEEFALKDLEWADGRWVVQYRNALLPVIPGSDRVDMRARDPRPVIVFSVGGQSLGLAVDSIRDIVHERIQVETGSRTQGLLGSIVVQGRTTELVDIDFWLAQARSRPDLEMAQRQGRPPNGSRRAQPRTANGATKSRGRSGGSPRPSRLHGIGSGRGRILLVDDSPSFVSIVVPMLRGAGFEVTATTDGRDAVERLLSNPGFDAVISDIDMPDLDGLELARTIRAVPECAGLPLIALTARSSDADRARGMQAGFDRYLVKLDRHEVISALESVVANAGDRRRSMEEALA